ncbi:MAG: hypothetical protein HZA66_05880 [Rhodopseudomonas palustris]|uniref:Virulence-associated protein E-like domain-containing protein n=1 Tax=Rhodopseudomonas palustris TaxID=1076 RepID=A0A933RUP6_RHOPL|nr:hypothetical protein [Rhodopseudomonas palustris]
MLDEPIFNERIAATVSDDDVYALLDWYADHTSNLKVEDIGWDIVRQGNASGCSLDHLATACRSFGDAVYLSLYEIGARGGGFDARDRYLRELRASFDRPRRDADRLIVDLIERLWPDLEVSAHTEAELQRLFDLAEANRARIVADESDCDRENDRLDELFLAAQSIARQRLDWLDVADPADGWKLPPKEVAAIRKIIETEGLPDPPRAGDLFAEWVHGHVESESWAKQMAEYRNDVALRAADLQTEVQRSFFAFSDWQRNAKTNIPEPTNPDNVRVFLRMKMAALRWNQWHQRAEVQERPDLYGQWAPLTDALVNRWMTEAGNTHNQFRPSVELFRRTITTIAQETPFDPVLDRLATLESGWDRVPRLDAWLPRAFGVEDTPYHRAVGRLLIGSIVRRARHPGSKRDEVVILIGPQDTFKSTACRLLSMDDAWFTDSVTFDGSPQNVIPQLFGKLAVELAELDGMAKREVNFVKRFLSTQSDSVTLKYQALASDHGRRCIFIGTSNEDSPLRDATGNRRFLPVRISQAIDIEWLRRCRDQVIGEAAALESAGSLFLLPRDVLTEARANQEGARAESDFEVYLRSWFEQDSGPVYVQPADLSTALKTATGRSVPPNVYGATMRALGFVQATPRLHGGPPVRLWHRGPIEGARRFSTVHMPAVTVNASGLVPLPRPGA